MQLAPPEIINAAEAHAGAPYPPFLASLDGVRKGRAQFATFGFAVFGPPALSSDTLRDLRADAARQRQRAAWPLNYGDGRSRVPEATLRGHFGPAARTFFGSSSVFHLMHAVTDEVVEPSWSASCYTWYDTPGAWLGRHCDKPDACMLTMLVGLESTWPSGKKDPPPGNQLWIYGSFEAAAPAFRVTTLVNRVVILDGKRWPHERQPVQEGQQVSVLCGCFRAAGK